VTLRKEEALRRMNVRRLMQVEESPPSKLLDTLFIDSTN
jgi:hypothetical protein